MATYINNNNETVDCPTDDKYSTWNDLVGSNNELKTNIDFNKSCFNICGEGYYVKTINGQPACFSCDDGDSNYSAYEDMCPDSCSSPVGETNNPACRDFVMEGNDYSGDQSSDRRISCEGAGCTYQISDRMENFRGEPNVPEWFARQKEANIGRTHIAANINWASDREEDSPWDLWGNAGELVTESASCRANDTSNSDDVTACASIGANSQSCNADERCTYISESTRIEYRPLTDNQIKGIAGGQKTTILITEGDDRGEYQYNFPEGYTDIDSLKRDINRNRGELVKCNEHNIPDWWPVGESCSGTDPYVKEDGLLSRIERLIFNSWRDHSKTAEESHFGPEHLIFEEVYDFYLQRQIDASRNRESAIQGDVGALSNMMGASTHNVLFEGCMNNIFKHGAIPDQYSSEEELMMEIQAVENISDLTSDHINYIKTKLKNIIQINEERTSECMHYLTIGESICNTGVSDKILQSAYLVVSILGLNKIDVTNIEKGTVEYIQLTRLINEFGNLLPKAFQKIIDISIYYEKQMCGETTTSTRVLKELYDRMYKDNLEVTLDVNPYFDMNTLIDKDPFLFFQKIALMFAIGYIVSKIVEAYGVFKPK